MFRVEVGVTSCLMESEEMHRCLHPPPPLRGDVISYPKGCDVGGYRSPREGGVDITVDIATHNTL